MEEKTACFFCRELNKTVFLETIIIVYKAKMSDIHTFIRWLWRTW